jgi:GH15 family glucan-1,4-alpha-glucosidase
MRTSTEFTGNIWFICTLWLAEYYIAKASCAEELDPALKILEWVAGRALPSGVLAEQMDPVSLSHVSVSPLTWSHSTFVGAVMSYIKKMRRLAGTS